VGLEPRSLYLAQLLDRLGPAASVDTKENKLVPMSLVLYQNYPNPFNPVTTIAFELSTPGKIQMIIFNVLGEKVRILKSGFHPAGSYAVIWDGLNQNGIHVPSGIYFYTLIEAAGNSQTRKMILVR